MSCSVCPNCGYALEPLAAFSLGDLFIDKGGAFVWWRKRPVPLTTAERLIVTTLARADGVPVRHDILAESTGSESEDPDNCAAVLISRVKRKFREVDAAFRCIETVRGQGVRWAA